MDSKEDEEINIDFSRIKNFFKKEGKEEKKEESQTASSKRETEDEISLDFSRIKNIFKSDEKEGSTDDGININWGRVGDFFKKYAVFFIALIPIILSIYIRMQAADLVFTDNWAESTVLNGLRNQIRSTIDQQYPNLPDANKNALVETELQNVISQNKGQIDETIKAYSSSFKSFFQDDNGKNYMADIDPYYWFRYAKNIVEHGHPGDIIKDGKPFDILQLAPTGRFVFPDMFHAYSSAYFYKFIHLFAPGLSIMGSMFYFTILVSALCVLLVFMIARKIAGNIGGFFAGMIMAVNGAFLSRSLHPDNDIWVVFFPLLVTWLFVTTIDMKNLFKIAAMAALAGFFTGLFATAWSGWWYIFDFLLATIAVTFVYLVLVNLESIKKSFRHVLADAMMRNIIVIGIVYFISTALFIAFFSGWNTFKNSFLGPLSFPSIKAPVDAYLWPNVLTTVAELNEGSIGGIINSIGGNFLFYISLLGLILSISRKEGAKKFDFLFMILSAIFYGSYFLIGIRLFGSSVFVLLVWIALPLFLRIAISIYRKDSSYDFKLPILLSLWVASTIFASLKGIRFTVLLAPAFSVAFGVALGKSYAYLSKWTSKELKMHKAIGSGVMIVLFLLVYIGPTRGAISAAESDIPIVNDAWFNTLTAIKQDSKQDAIITSWWDFGHHFKALAERKVTFDGTTQTYPAAHWVGKLLMVDDEKRAAGILRMLDCGSNKAFDSLQKAGNDSHKALKILNEIMVLDKEEARAKLIQHGFNVKQAQEVLEYTHCNPPEAYFIASDDMIGKSGVWSHFGSWDFERADIWFNTRSMPLENAVDYMMKKFNYTKERAESTYFEIQALSSNNEANAWIAPWPGYGGTVTCRKSGNDYLCDNGLQINLTSYDIFGMGQQGIIRPKVAVFTTENGVFRKEFNGTTLDFGMTIIPKSDNELLAIVSSKELTGGIFTRMFYMSGHGLKYFKPFNHQRGLTGTDIYTYKVDWEGKNSTIVEEYGRLLSVDNTE